MPNNIEDQKQVEFYAASVAAWYNTSLEHDKSLFALSAGGIGLLITLLTTVGLPSAFILALYIAAIVSFLVCIVAVLIIFRRNGTHIMEIVSSGAAGNDKMLEKLDLAALYAFGAGAVFAALIGMSSAVNSFNKSKEKIVANEGKEPTSTRALAQDSFNGVANFQKSFNGAGGLQTQQPVASTTAQTPAPAAPAVATTATAAAVPQQEGKK